METLPRVMSEFDEIRPYDDHEVPGVLSRLVSDREFLDAIIRFRSPTLGGLAGPVLRPYVRSRLQAKLRGVHTVADFQSRIEDYMQGMIDDTVDTLTVSGLENLERNRAHLFISNHRDIAMDPAFVNWTLYHQGFTTLRIAIGDNLLTKPFASDLMRLNKSFIVNRSAKSPREKFKAAKLLSKYIHHSVVHDNENVWIAQREGRAKDGRDLTNPAIVSMLMLNKKKADSIGQYVEELRIVPVSISYEYDPCDQAKAKEITHLEEHGAYQKEEHEDVRSIAQGIVGYKGRVHLSFGRPLNASIESDDEITAALDRDICANYVLHPTNAFAFELLEKRSPHVVVGNNQTLFTELELHEPRQRFQAHVDACDVAYREALLRSYANPVYRKLDMTQ